MSRARIAITGMGVATAVAGNVPEFVDALRTGRQGVGRVDGQAVRVGAFLKSTDWEPTFEQQNGWEDALKRARKVLRGAPVATRVAVLVALEALAGAGACSGE